SKDFASHPIRFKSREALAPTGAVFFQRQSRELPSEAPHHDVETKMLAQELKNESTPSLNTSLTDDQYSNSMASASLPEIRMTPLDSVIASNSSVIVTQEDSMSTLNKDEQKRSSIDSTVMGNELGQDDLALNTTENELCDDDYEWNADKGICTRILVGCPRSMIMDKKTQKCIKHELTGIICLPGYVFNTETNKCVGRFMILL
ncbi:unnamed protein product, partial [Protopolystoma xenopodis]